MSLNTHTAMPWYQACGEGKAYLYGPVPGRSRGASASRQRTTMGEPSLLCSASSQFFTQLLDWSDLFPASTSHSVPWPCSAPSSVMPSQPPLTVNGYLPPLATQSPDRRTLRHLLLRS